jgi:hypothetical protein
MLSTRLPSIQILRDMIQLMQLGSRILKMPMDVHQQILIDKTESFHFCLQVVEQTVSGRLPIGQNLAPIVMNIGRGVNLGKGRTQMA